MLTMQVTMMVSIAVLLALGAAYGAHAREFKHWKVSCMLVFGDSTVDTGNNNRLPTEFRANFLPYGKDFFDGRPTGRFCDGRLAIDFIAESLGISMSVPAFLDPNLTPEQLKRGVSFASASSGYDELTAHNAAVLSFPKQIEYLKHYKLHLTKLFGLQEAQKTIEDSFIVISAGTNDFIQNYYIYDNRSKEFTEPQYQDYLVARMSKFIKKIYKLGARQFVVVGVPPMGCLPVVMALMNSDGCYGKFNDAAISFNSKVVKQLSLVQQELGVKSAYLDIYRVIEQVAENPLKYGFTETKRGCCGSGTFEIGMTCKGQTICGNPSNYMYFDAVHPTEKLYKVIADVALNDIGDVVLA